MMSRRNLHASSSTTRIVLCRGDGTFDLRRYLELLLATGYEGFLSLELFREDLWKQDPVDVAREGLEKMRQVVEG